MVGLTHVHAAYLANLTTILIVKRYLCPDRFHYEPFMKECFYGSLEAQDFFNASRICKEKGWLLVSVTASSFCLDNDRK